MTNHFRSRTWAFVLAFLFGIGLTFAQYNSSPENTASKLTLSYQELLDRMASYKDSVFILENATIRFDPAKDQRFMLLRDSLALTEIDTIYVNSKIQLKNIEFEEAVGKDNFPAFAKIKFEDEVLISEAKVTRALVFLHCTFESEVQISLEKSSIDNLIAFSESILRSYSSFQLTKGRILSIRCLFDPINKKRLSRHIFRTDHEESFKNNQFIGVVSSKCREQLPALAPGLFVILPHLWGVVISSVLL